MIELDAVRYWLSESLGLLRNVVETESEIQGEFQDHHGFRPFRIKKSALSDHAARTRGTVMAVSRCVSTLTELGHMEEYAEEAKQILLALTGLDLATPSEWEAWFEENREYLYWSPDQERLLIDEEAKQAGMPTLEYRKR